MIKQTNRELSIDDYIRMRKIIIEKDLEIELLNNKLDRELDHELDVYRNIEPVYYPVVVICYVVGMYMSILLISSC